MPVKNVSGYRALTSEYNPSADRKSCESDMTDAGVMRAYGDAAGTADARAGDHDSPLALGHGSGHVQESSPLGEELMVR